MKKNILHFTPDINFAVKFVLPICSIQQQNGNVVRVVTTDLIYKNTKKLNIDEGFNGFNKNNFIFLKLNILKFCFRTIYDYFVYLKILFSCEYDVVIFHTSTYSSLPMFCAKCFGKANIIYFNHGVPYLGYTGITKLFLMAIEKWNLFTADVIFTIGGSMKKALLNINDKVSINMFGSGSACGIVLLTKRYSDLYWLRANARLKLNIPTHKKVVLFVGRPVKRKGFFDLIEAWDDFASNDDFLLLCVGAENGECTHKYFSDNIDFIGYVSDVTDFYLAADFLCVPSYHEGLGYVYLEAAACGCIPICSDIPGPTDFIIDGYNGITVKPKSPKAISSCLFDLFGDTHRISLISRNAFYSSQNYDREILKYKIFEQFGFCD
jgi:glycosyltransferase involved in cell wall biosynthesis